MRLRLEFSRFVFDSQIYFGAKGDLPLLEKKDIFSNKSIHTPKSLKNYKKINNINKLMIAPLPSFSEHELFVNTNPSILNAVEPENIYGVLFVSPENHENTIDVLNSVHSHNKIKGFKIYPEFWKDSNLDPASLDSKKLKTLKQVIRYCKDQRKILQIELGNRKSDFEKLKKFIEEFAQDLRLHLVLSFYDIYNIVKLVPKYVDWLQRGHDIYLDLSILPVFAAAYLIRELNVLYSPALDRILFSSSVPLSDFETRLMLIKSLNLNIELESKILYENANHLYCPGEK